MSTTTSLEVALKYSVSRSSAVLLRMLTSSFMQRGADLSFLSAFPSEAEILYPPLTYLEVRRTCEVEVDDSMRWTVVDVLPHHGC